MLSHINRPNVYDCVCRDVKTDIQTLTNPIGLVTEVVKLFT